MFNINVISVAIIVVKCSMDHNFLSPKSFALFIKGVMKKQISINEKLVIKKIIDGYFILATRGIVNIAIRDNNAIIKKNFGHIYLSRMLASLMLISLFIAGAIKID